jgi:hypothetical protein
MGLMKCFQEVKFAMALKEKIEAIGIDVLMKRHIQSARLAGFGSSGSAVELFVQKQNLLKVNPVIEEFRLSI